MLFVFILLILSGSSPGSTAKAALSIVAVIALLSSFVLSIVGLVDVGGGVSKPAHGRGQAIAALVLSSLTGLGVLFFAVTTVVMKAQEARKTAARSAGTGQPIELETERFRLKTLPTPWVKIDPKKLNPLACLAIHADPAGNVLHRHLRNRVGGAGGPWPSTSRRSNRTCARPDPRPGSRRIPETDQRDGGRPECWRRRG
jgi:hypothetical protein